MKPVEPISTVELFPPLSRELIAVLKGLRPADWGRPTVCSPWSVKDVAAHLLGGNLGRLRKAGKASKPAGAAEQDYDALVRLINRENEAWVQAARRISPETLIALLELTDRYLYEHFRSLDPNGPARVAVAWAGESLSPNWFDIAREYTEKWHHQQHIREATGQPLLLGRAWLFPVLDTFMRGLHHSYRYVDAEEGTIISVRIRGEAGGTWSLAREDGGWRLLAGFDPEAAGRVEMEQDLAWRLFTKGAGREEARRQVQIEGDERLGSQVLQMVAIMA